MNQLLLNGVYKPYAKVLAEEVSDKELRTILEENLEDILDKFSGESQKPVFGDPKELNIHYTEFISKFKTDRKIRQFLNYGSFYVAGLKKVNSNEVTVRDVISATKEDMKHFRNVGPTIIEYAQKFFEDNYNITFN